jgi:hypothetical protein
MKKTVKHVVGAATRPRTRRTIVRGQVAAPTITQRHFFPTMSLTHEH